MAWIKRNLIFVIAVAVGLIATGYCGYLLYSSVDANAGVREEYNTTLNNYTELTKRPVAPTQENIKATKDDQERIRLFLADFKKRFAPFPTPPVKDAQGFKAYLDDKLVQFRAEATNAGVELPAEFRFAFSSLVGKLTPPAGSIAPWMEQLQQISAILNIVFDAKVTYLADLKRVPVSPDDTSATDCMSDQPTTNVWGVVTPYRISFRGFSADIASVLAGFAKSSNCFIVKSVQVAPDTTVQLTTPQATLSPTMQPQAAPAYMRPQPPSVRTRPRNSLLDTPFSRPAPMPASAPVAAAPVANTFAPPVTILTEYPLMVTISVEVVKLNSSDK